MAKLTSPAALPTMRSTAGDRPPPSRPRSRSRGAKPRPQASQWYQARSSVIPPSAVVKVLARRPARCAVPPQPHGARAPASSERSAFSAAANALAIAPRAASRQARSSRSKPAASGTPSPSSRAASPSSAAATCAPNAGPGAPFFPARPGGGRPRGVRISRR